MEKLKEKLRGFGLKEWGMILIAGLCCLIIVLPAEEKESTEPTVKNTEYIAENEKEEEQDYVKELEHRLEELLSCVEAVSLCVSPPQPLSSRQPHKSVQKILFFI